jgi:DUF4097 and DUF4098 domain-containing protein YvlB
MKSLSTLCFAAVCVVSAAPAAQAQDATVRHKQVVVIPHDLAAEVQRMVHEMVENHLARDISRDVGRAMRDLARDLSRDFSHYAPGGRGVSVDDQRQDFKAEQSDRKTHTVTLGASGALDLSNVVGDITVKAGSGREATVEVVRTSRGRTDADAKTGLEKVTVEMKTGPDRASFAAKYPDERRPPYSVSVAYNVTAPAGTRITAHSVSGDVTVTGLKGELTVSTVAGDVTATSVGQIGKINTVSGDLILTDVATDNSLEASVVAGDVTLKNVKARRVTASSVSGSITASGIQAASVNLHSMSGGIEFAGPVAASGRYEFQSHSGDVVLALAGGYDVDVTTFSGKLAADPNLGLTTTTGMRQAVRGTVDKGGATVKVTTFSGDVRISRPGSGR